MLPVNQDSQTVFQENLLLKTTGEIQIRSESKQGRRTTDKKIVAMPQAPKKPELQGLKEKRSKRNLIQKSEKKTTSKVAQSAKNKSNKG